ncbi:NAD(P)/FAD-dependent oxidoreductase [Cohnella sp. GCM10027633]|uniref:NAD(P)/FAD-dependent oxidoreductase n=1 Tax=unclassified Cohnella TaxID=2636738 RepID=UPI00362923EE
MNIQLTDVAIIGGGPAGMSAALVLGRARRNVVVIDEGRPRNRVTKEMHGFLTRDGMTPDEFRRVAREQIAAYASVRFVEEAAVGVDGVDGDFRVTTASGGTVRSKKLLFATGMKDGPLGIPGLVETYGKSAFVCPYCDGWELRDQPLVVIAKGAQAMHSAKTLSGWTGRIAVCSDGPAELTEAQRLELKRHRVPVYESPIDNVVSVGGMAERVVLADRTSVPCKGIFFAPRLVPGSQLPMKLGCQATSAGNIVVDPFGKSSVPGVYGAGDAATELYQAIVAASKGSLAAVGINAELIDEAWGSGGR